MKIHQGKKLKEILSKRKIRHESISTKDFLGFSRQSLSALLTKEKLTKAQILLFCSLLGIEPEELGASSLSLITEYSKIIDFSNIKISNATFTSKYLKSINWSNSRIFDSNFNHAFMPFSNLQNVNFKNTSFEKASLYGSDWSNSRISDSNFNHASMASSKFQNVTFKNVSFENSILYNSDFSNGEFNKCILAKADLKGVNLEKANFTQANLQGCNLDGVTNWENIIIHHALISDIKNPPKGFMDWVKGFEIHQDLESYNMWKDSDLGTPL